MDIEKELLEKILSFTNIAYPKEENKSEFATYLGAKGTVYIMGVVVDSKGNYIVLYVEQYKKKKVINKIEVEQIGARIYLVKISPDGKQEEGRIIYEGEKYIEVPMSIEIDKDDNIYITGMAITIPTDFKIDEIIKFIIEMITKIIEGDVLDNIPLDFLKCFLLKFNSNEMKIDEKPIYSIYFGGKGINLPFSLADDRRGHIWIAGMTSSKDFPINTIGAPVFQNENRGDLDVFICKINEETKELEYSTYVGGEIRDIAQSIFIDDNGDVYVTGIADKVENEDDLKKVGKFNTTPLSFQGKFGGGLSDAFVIKLKNNGRVVYCSYLGMEDNDIGTSITADKDGNAYVTGATGRNFIIKGNAFQKQLGYKNEGIFIAKINENGTEMIASTYLGGNYSDSSKMITIVDDDISIYGSTSSKDFPMCSQTYNPIYFGDSDVFFCKLSLDLSTLKFSSYLGGTKREASTAMLILKNGDFLLLGDTLSKDFPVTEDALHDKFDNVKGEGFLFRYTPKSFDKEVIIPDINLKKALCNILGKKEDYKITEFDFMILPRYLDLKNKEIENLQGLQYAKYLLGIDLSNNLVKDIVELSNLKYLNYLDLRNNKIKDVTSLGNIVNLSYLYISDNEIEDISSLEDLNMISELKGENNNIKFIKSLEKMTRLRSLNLDNNSVGNLSFLNNDEFLSKITVLNQKISKKVIKKTSDDVVISLEFLKKIDSSLPIIFDISNNGVVDLKKQTITWRGIEATTDLTFQFKGINNETSKEYMSGQVIVNVEIDNSGVIVGDIFINGFSTFIAFETSGNLVSMVKDSGGNCYVLYNEYDVISIATQSIPVSRRMVIKKISSDGKRLLGMKKIIVDGTGVKLNRSLTAKAMVIDDNDDIYIVGNTNWSKFPTTVGVIRPKMDPIKSLLGIGTEGFIMKFRGENFNEGDKPVYSTFLGGKGVDLCESIAVDKEKNIWVIGMTNSEDFPITREIAYKKDITSKYGNVFMTKLNRNFSKVEYSTLLGGEAIDAFYGVTVDKDGNVYGTGTAEYIVADEYRQDEEVLPQGKWRTTDNAYQRKFGGGQSDAFVVKFKSNGEVVYVTYLGGNKMDIGAAITVDDNGCVYIAGYTKGDFIITENAYLKIYDAKEAGIFITKLSADGQDVNTSTYFGGSYSNFVKAITVSGDKVYLVGSTNSLDYDTTRDALQREYKSGSHGFLAVFNKDLDKLEYSTFIGGTSTDVVNSVVVDKKGVIYLAGATSSSDFPVSKDVYSERYSNNPEIIYMSGDGFLMKLVIDDNE